MDGYYFLVGIDTRGYPDPTKGAGNGEPGWVLRKNKRGSRTLDEPFPTEDAVCRAAWEELKPRPRTPILELTSEELTRGRTLAAEHKRDYERATEELRQERRTAQDGGVSMPDQERF